MQERPKWWIVLPKLEFNILHILRPASLPPYRMQYDLRCPKWGKDKNSRSIVRVYDLFKQNKMQG